MSILLEKNLRTVMQDAESSVISKIGYDVNRKELYVLFKSDQLYIYTGVPLIDYCELKFAKSIGTFYNKNIKGVYSSIHVSYMAINPYKDFYYNTATNEIFENNNNNIFSKKSIKKQKIDLIAKTLNNLDELGESEVDKIYAALKGYIK